MRVVTLVRGLRTTAPHISLTCPVVIGYTTKDHLCSIKYFRGPRYIAQRGGGAHARRHDGEGPRLYRAPNQCPYAKAWQERMVAHNTACSFWPVASSPGRPGNGDLPVTWLALSEFRYCRHKEPNCLMWEN
jgi:hypothetical protein